METVRQEFTPPQDPLTSIPIAQLRATCDMFRAAIRDACVPHVAEIERINPGDNFGKLWQQRAAERESQLRTKAAQFKLSEGELELLCVATVVNAAFPMDCGPVELD